MNETISVIVPIYNVEEYLPECIQSIQNQTYTNLEILLIDDGSTDLSGEICERYAQSDARIIVIHKLNGGTSEARNFGLDAATGDYIGFVDSDDYIDPCMYETMLLACKNSEKMISCCGRYKVKRDHLVPVFVLEASEVWDSETAIANLLTWQNLDSSMCDKLFSASCFSSLRFPLGKVVEDVYLVSDLLHVHNGIVHVGKPFYYYRLREGSKTNEIFSPKRFDLVDASLYVSNYIIDRYPSLKLQALSYYYRSVISIGEMFSTNLLKKQYPSEYERWQKLHDGIFLKVLLNRYIPNGYKVKSWLLKLSLYIAIYQFVRRLKR